MKPSPSFNGVGELEAVALEIVREGTSVRLNRFVFAVRGDIIRCLLKHPDFIIHLAES
jgi:hypothetical protein